jgi:hypothetical protein
VLTESVARVLEQNDRARRFYSAMGFNPDGATRVEAAGTAFPLPEVRYSRPIAGAAQHAPQRIVIRQRGRGATASFHRALSPRWIAQRAVAELRR